MVELARKMPWGSVGSPGAGGGKRFWRLAVEIEELKGFVDRMRGKCKEYGTDPIAPYLRLAIQARRQGSVAPAGAGYSFGDGTQRSRAGLLSGGPPGLVPRLPDPIIGRN